MRSLCRRPRHEARMVLCVPAAAVAQCFFLVLVLVLFLSLCLFFLACHGVSKHAAGPCSPPRQRAAGGRSRRGDGEGVAQARTEEI